MLELGVKMDHGEKRSESESIGADVMSKRRKKETPNEPTSPQKPGYCNFFLNKKRRYCKQRSYKELTFCAEHSTDESICSRKRIPCPLDPKHSCFEDKLEKHLKNCHARIEKDLYYKAYCNGSQEVDNRWVRLCEVSSEELLDLVTRVKAAAADVPAMSEELLFHESMRTEVDKPMNGPQAQKHLRQNASLVSHLEKAGLLSDGNYYVEFGAGKGGMSHWVQRALPSSQDCHFTLVEKCGVRYKLDSYHRGDDQGPNFERLKIDIQHFDLSVVESLVAKPRPVVGIGKHVCGAATDFMLRCLMENNLMTEGGNSCSGLVLALCCHHRCSWASYVGRTYLLECGFTPRQAQLLASMSTWATDGTANTATKRKEINEPQALKPAVQTEDSSGKAQDSESIRLRQEKSAATQQLNSTGSPQPAGTEVPVRHPSLTPEVRESIGYMCKNLIDYGRIRYLEQHGYTARMVVYTSQDLSRENRAVVALKKS